MTIFTTPILRPILKFIAWLVLLVWGWRPTTPPPPGLPKCVLIVAPHTSYWDFALFLPICFSLDLKLRVLIKHTLFWPPLGWFLRYCGGIPVDRRSAKNYVKELAGEFEKRDFFHLLVTPEGTRSPRTHWKTGFYHIAQAANVPILMAAVDEKTKRVGVDRILYPSGDLDADMAEIYAFYDQFGGLRPENYASPNKPGSDVEAAEKKKRKK